MGWKSFAGAVAAAAAVVPGCALADPLNLYTQAGPYLGLDVGYNAPLAINAHSLSPAPDGRPYQWQFQNNADWAAFGKVGWRFSPHFRVEIDAGLRESNIHSIHAAGANVGGFAAGRPGEPFGLCDRSQVPPPCKLTIGNPHLNWAYADDGMINAIYDIAPKSRINPFVGVGLGVYHLQFNSHFFFSGVPGPITPTNPATQMLQLGGSINRTSQFATQGVAGVSYRLGRRVAMDFTYRFIAAPSLRWNTLNDTPGVQFNQGLQPNDFRGVAENHTVTLGVRYAL